VSHPTPSYGPPPGYGPAGIQPQEPQGTNGLAIASLVLAFLLPPLSIVLGIVALVQIRGTGQSGRGLAIAGTVISTIFVVIAVVYIVLIIVILAGAKVI
jgi:peptidyl-prolyl cis-trans isomerase B (cyclophilin B)